MRNRRGADNLLAVHSNGGGSRYCAREHSSDSELGWISNQASSVAMLHGTDNRC